MYRVYYKYPDKDAEYYQTLDSVDEASAAASVRLYLKSNNIVHTITRVECLFDTTPKDKTILDEVNDIIYKRDTEKERLYGPFNEGMERAAKIWSGMTGKDLSARDMYLALIALKFSRDSYNPKYDNLLDMMAYAVAMYENQKHDYDKTK
jgi:hypothetical protein